MWLEHIKMINRESIVVSEDRDKDQQEIFLGIFFSFEPLLFNVI